MNGHAEEGKIAKLSETPHSSLVAFSPLMGLSNIFWLLILASLKFKISLLSDCQIHRH
jgi:hypothetical protein